MCRMGREKRCALTWAFSGPDRSRTCDLTRASRAKPIYGYSQAFTFSAIYAGHRALAPHVYSHLLPSFPNCVVRDLLGQNPRSPKGPWARGGQHAPGVDRESGLTPGCLQLC